MGRASVDLDRCQFVYFAWSRLDFTRPDPHDDRGFGYHDDGESNVWLSAWHFYEMKRCHSLTHLIADYVD